MVSVKVCVAEIIPAFFVVVVVLFLGVRLRIDL